MIVFLVLTQRENIRPKIGTYIWPFDRGSRQFFLRTEEITAVGSSTRFNSELNLLWFGWKKNITGREDEEKKVNQLCNPCYLVQGHSHWWKLETVSISQILWVFESLKRLRTHETFSFLFGGWNGAQKNKDMFEPRGLSVLILGKNMQTL